MVQPQITYRGMEPSAAMDARILEYASKLEEFHSKVTMCHVIVDMRDRRKSKGNHFEVRIDAHVPGRELVASRQEHIDPYVAMHEAFQVMYRQLEEDMRRKRGHVKFHEDERGEDAAP